MTLRKPILEDWSLFGDCLVGRVSGHPTIADGRQVITSRLEKLDTQLGVAKTRNREYWLGKPYASDATVQAENAE